MPVIPIAAIAAASLFAVDLGIGAYNGYRSYQAMVENERYWDDYYKNTGHRPRYPMRAGAYNDLARLVTPISSGVRLIDDYYSQQNKRSYRR